MSKILKEVNVREIENMEIAYVRHVGPYKESPEVFGKLFDKLCSWAGPRGLINPPETKMLTVYHDDPAVVEEAKQRISVSLTVGKDVEGSYGIERMTIEGGSYVVGSFELTPNQYGEAWSYIYSEWLLTSGYKPVEKLCFEVYLNNPSEHPEGKHIVDIYVPVEKA